MGQVLLDSKLLLETVEKGGVHGTLSFSLSKYLCSTAARWILRKDGNGKIFALEELKSSKQIVTWEGGIHPNTYQLAGTASQKGGWGDTDG